MIKRHRFWWQWKIISHVEQYSYGMSCSVLGVALNLMVWNLGGIRNHVVIMVAVVLFLTSSIKFWASRGLAFRAEWYDFLMTEGSWNGREVLMNRAAAEDARDRKALAGFNEAFEGALACGVNLDAFKLMVGDQMSDRLELATTFMEAVIKNDSTN